MPNPIVSIYISGHFPLSNNKPQNLSQAFKVFNNAKKNRGYMFVFTYCAVIRGTVYLALNCQNV